jgi:hypothetical protein
VFAFLLGAARGAGAVARADGPPPSDPAATLGTAFTYQGQLRNSGQPVSGNCDMGFRLYGQASGGAPVASAITQTVAVAASQFTVALDFGAGAFNGNPRWLDITLRCPSGSGAFTHLAPRQALTAAPYALYALKAANAWSLTGNAGTNGSNFLGTTDSMTLTLAVGGTAAVRYIPGVTTVNILGGSIVNTMTVGLNGAVIAGGGDAGFANSVRDWYGTVSGGYGNVAGGYASLVAGGSENQANGSWGTVGGGQFNSTGSTQAVVAGGYNNAASGYRATVAGGDSNAAGGEAAAVGGGYANAASDKYAVVSGGSNNAASGEKATVGGGNLNAASGFAATVGGGFTNAASGGAATVPGGFANSAAGNYSFAAGRNANAAHDGAFVWADSTGTAIASTVADQFLIHASGGVTMYTDLAATVGAALAPGSGSWSIVSDRNLKGNFAPVDELQVLDALAGIPMQSWNYTSQDAAIRHLGPMAQDFRAAFGLGENDTTISTVDAQGVALAGVQGLYHLAQDQAAQLESQQAQIDDMQARLAAIEQPGGAVSGRPAAQLPAAGWLLFGGLLLLNLGGVAGYLLARRGWATRRPEPAR